MSTETEDRRQGWQARAANRRRHEARKAAELETRGWVCVPPERAAEARELLETRNPR